MALFGCTSPGGTRDHVPSVPAPEDLAAPTPEPPRVFPAPRGFVSDFAEVLDPDFERESEGTLSEFRQNHKIDFAVVTVSTTGPELIDDYSLEMAKEWKIGSDNGGLLLLVSIDDRKWRIQIDRKLERSMSNDEVLKIGELMVPEFKKKQYGAGIRKCMEAMITSLTKKLNHVE